MNKITFFVPGKAVPQPRHRVSIRGTRAHAYLPKKSPIHAWKNSIESRLIQAGHNNKKISDPVKLKAQFLMPIPAYLKNKVSGNTPHIKKIDIDNLLKAVMDVLTQTGVIVDDCLVYEIMSQKFIQQSLVFI